MGGYKKIRPEDNPKPWVKGQTGNPNGQPRSFKKIFAEISDKDREILIAKLIQKGKAGDLRAIEAIIDRIDGKVKQDIGIEGSITLNFDKEDAKA